MIQFSYIVFDIFEQLSVHWQEDCTSSFMVYYHASIWTV